MINIVNATQLKLECMGCLDSILIDMSLHSTKRTPYFSPYFPWGNIPVPFSNGMRAQSVMSIWEGLKVFEFKGIDKYIFSCKNIKYLKRPEEKYGNLKGYNRGLSYDYIYNEAEAFQRIYIRSFRWALEHNAYIAINWLRSNLKQDIILIDNPDECIPNQLTPATLLKAYILGEAPFEDVIQEIVVHQTFCCGRKEFTTKKTEYRYASIPPADSITNGIFEFDF